jgi:hypothetical protein
LVSVVAGAAFFARLRGFVSVAAVAMSVFLAFNSG